MTDFTDLENIFRMMAPSDLFGVPKNVFGSNDQNIATNVTRDLFDQQGGGAVTAAGIRTALANTLLTTPAELKSQFHQSIRFYSTEGYGIEPTVNWYYQVASKDQKTPETLGGFETILGAKDPLSKRGKRMAIILSTSNFISPATRKAATSEMFLNFIPTYVMSRCVPYLDAEFVFDRQVTAGNKLAGPSLLKFLMGAQDTTGDAAKNFPPGSANSLMAIGNTVETNNKTLTIAGMEMFTSPQTLVNASPVPNGSRYVAVLDPFRPFASIESFTINISQTVGQFSYKKATLTLKLHDRSRLGDIADLIQPQVYTKTTVWLTYGWRHPNEVGNPYADFINDNMLIREAWGIVNSGYSFDSVGQVTVTLELFTKGVRELRDIRITGLSESFEDIQRQISALAEDISTYRQLLNLDKPTGTGKEIRSSVILDSGERGEFPDFTASQVQETITNLQKSLLASAGKIDKDAVNKLTSALQQLYATNGTTKQATFNFKERLERQVSKTVNALFAELQTGPDPFLMTAARDSDRIKQLNLAPGAASAHPFVSLAESYNKIRQADKAPSNKTSSGDPGPAPFLKRLVSFGKIFSVFVGRGVVSVAGIDELQLFFYNFNERAGKAANVNIAEFPIDLAIFFEQFKDHVNRNRSDHITLEEFMKLVIQAQLGDVRGVGYGFFTHFEPYDPKNTEPQLKKNEEQEYENAYNGKADKLGPFNIPTIEVYVESTYVTSAGKKTDLLSTFSQAAQQDAGRKGDMYTRVMRIHVYDRQVNPHPMATSLLKKDNAGPGELEKLRSELYNDQYQNAITKGLSGLPQDIQNALRLDKDHGVVPNDLISNEKIKHFVSKLIPTIVYGGNASTVISANVTTKQDPLLSAVQTMANKAGRPSVTQPNGGGMGGLPLRIIPAQITVTSQGCPTLDFMQLFFIDFNTGTTIDNVYGITGLTHTIGPGKFETTLTLSFYDAYGRYENPVTFLKEVGLLDVPQ